MDTFIIKISFNSATSAVIPDYENVTITSVPEMRTPSESSGSLSVASRNNFELELTLAANSLLILI